MIEIKSLADQLRDTIRSGVNEHTSKKQPITDQSGQPTEKKKKNSKSDSAEALALFSALEAFRFEGSEKSMIRVDIKTMNLLKRIKLAKGIDMNKFIVYCLQQYIAQHPWLPNYITETLKNTEI